MDTLQHAFAELAIAEADSRTPQFGIRIVEILAIFMVFENLIPGVTDTIEMLADCYQRSGLEERFKEMKDEAGAMAPELEKVIFAGSTWREVKGGETEAEQDAVGDEALGDVVMDG